MAALPLVTDEFPDRYLFRPPARALARGLVHTPVTPNQVSVVAALCGIGAGVALGFELPVAFVVLIGLMLVLDCVDGQLARLRGGGTVWGRIVDGLGDYTTAIAVHFGLIAWLSRDHGSFQGVVWGIAAGLSMAWSAYLMDKLKRRYRGDLDDIDAVQRALDDARGLKRFLVSGFLPYAASVNLGPEVANREAYCRRVRPAMVFWLWLGPTTHYMVAAVLVLLGRPLLYAQVATVLFGALTLAAVVLQYRLESTPSADEGAGT